MNPSRLTKKNKTFTGVDPSKKTFEEKYRLNNVFFVFIIQIAQRKVMLALSLAEKFIKAYEKSKATKEKELKRLH